MSCHSSTRNQVGRKFEVLKDYGVLVIGQWESWTDWSDCFLNPLDKFMTVSTRSRTCQCDNCTIYCNGPTVERKKCADLGHCRGLDEVATQKIRSCLSEWDQITNDCECPPGKFGIKFML